jgi:hypothetical protein
MRESGRYEFGPGGQYRLSVASSITGRRKAWKLVYDVYSQKGYAPADGSDLWYSHHDSLPDTTTFLVTRGDEAVATLTTVFDGVIGLPADEVYVGRLDELRLKGRRLCEITSLACTERHGGDEVVMHLFRAAYATARYLEDATDFVITVNPHHCPYYRRVLRFEKEDEERMYSKVAGAPAVLMRLDLETAVDRYREACEIGLSRRNLHAFFEGGIDDLCRWVSRRRAPLDWDSLREYFGIRPVALQDETRRGAQKIALSYA